MTNQESTTGSAGRANSDPPTFSRDISPLFTQYDAIQMYYSFDLRSYEDVKEHADAIYRVVQEDPENPGQSKLPGIPVMPLYEAQWTEEMVATFKAWIDAGYPPGELPPPPPTPTPELPEFIALSEVLTGLTGLDDDPELAQTYLNRLIAEATHSSSFEQLWSVWQSLGSLSADQEQAAVGQEIMANPELEPLAKEIILIWYNATINGVFGTPENNQYTEARVLVCVAVSSHGLGHRKTFRSIGALSRRARCTRA